MKFVDIVTHAQQKKLGFDIGFPAYQKSAETVVIFQDPESPFDLNGPVHPVLSSLQAQDVLQGFFPFLHKYF